MTAALTSAAPVQPEASAQRPGHYVGHCRAQRRSLQHADVSVPAVDDEPALPTPDCHMLARFKRALPAISRRFIEWCKAQQRADSTGVARLVSIFRYAQ
jgi:hypothetical protein